VLVQMQIRNDLLHFIICKASSSIILWNKDIIRGDWSGDKTVCLSFDCDFPKDMATCHQLNEFLLAQEVPVSYAIPGQLVTQFPEIVSEIIHSGGEIINHTFSHPPNFRVHPIGSMEEEIDRFQNLMVTSFKYQPKGFRCPHGLRNFSEPLFAILKARKMYDSSLLGNSMINMSGLVEIPMSTCPEHPLLAFDSYHHFRFPLFSSSEKKILRLWEKLIEANSFVNIFMDPLDITGENRVNMLREMIKSARNHHFSFQQMGQMNEKFCT
jgi:peptidoglycan-N-acetylglucosamine deacetylase